MPTIWPPDDFALSVEVLRTTAHGSVPVQRFSIRADGVCLYSLATGEIGSEQLVLPVYGNVCAYRLLAVNTRQLARSVHLRGILDLEPRQGDQRDSGSRSLRMEYRAFGERRVIEASGQIHGSLVRILHVVNAYLPPGEAFDMPGMFGDSEPTNLSGVPKPADDPAGAAQCFASLLTVRPHDADLLLDAFALACARSELREAQQLLAKWVDTTGLSSTPAAPFADPPRVTGSMLQDLLPTGG